MMQRRRLFALALCASAWSAARPALAQSQPAPAAAGAAPTPPALELAGTWRSGQSLSGWWVSEKLDGVRAFWDGHTLRTRSGRRLSPPPWFTAGWPRVPLDGELWAGRGQFEQVQSTVGKQQASDAEWQRLRFMVFDMPAHGGVFDARLAAMQATLPKASNPALQVVPQRRVDTEAQLQKLLKDTVRQGGEGLMLHRGDAPYTAGRSANLLKLKDHEDAEARVVRHIRGKGKNAKRMGALLVETPEGKQFRLGTGFTDAQRENPPPVGTWVTYRYRGVHADSGLPRFASFVRVRGD